ncbi:MAG: glycosyltransferase [Chloroflexi bacterium]|nr:glycosyltransferase [Chloroflexota bacterium]
MTSMSTASMSATNSKPIRVLFLQISWQHTSEYNVHRLLAEHIDPDVVDCFFIWQTHIKDEQKNRPVNLLEENRNFYYDFGRDMSLKPKPAKWKRAFMMFIRLPLVLYYLIGKIRNIQPDIIYTSQQFYETILGSFLSSFFHIPHFIHVSYPVGMWLGKATVNIIIHTPNLIACSQFVKDTVVEEGADPEQIEVLLHGANVEKYAIPRDPVWLRKEFDLPADARIVITAARLDPGKGYLVLLRAFAKVYEVYPSARLIACGENTTGTGYDTYIKEFALDLNLDEAVVFSPYRDDLNKLFAGADIFCLPTKEDALPLVFWGRWQLGCR